MIRSLQTALVLLLFCGSALPSSPALTVLPEHVRVDPFGNIVKGDRSGNASPQHQIGLQVPRGGYGSLQLLVAIPDPASYTLQVERPRAASTIATEAFREWFHFLPASSDYYPDALIPIELPFQGVLPDPQNHIPRQTVQAFWLDVWVPAATSPGTYYLIAKLQSREIGSSLSIRLEVLRSVIPPEDAVVIDHNSYGTSWFASQYPNLLKRHGSGFYDSAALFELIHSYHRIFFNHRGSFHQLGYGHAGKVGPEFAPQLVGWGKNKHVSSWSLYDRHYGPLLDGSAFADTRRGPKPVPSVYLPINPEWPAAYVSWGEAGYEREFVNIVSEMERHFRQKGWTHTNFELFFNHKKRYRGFEWDGDEARFPKDYAYFREYARMLKLALPADTPVKFVFRADVSWTMEKQWRELAGIVNFWVCGGGMFSWFPYAPDMLKQRGDTVWTYGGTPPVSAPSSAITLDVLRTWMQGVQGFVRWETTAPGPDPWFRFAGGEENMIYPGDRFAIAGPLPSIRLKLERNAVQDVDLLEVCARRLGRARMEMGVAHAFNNTRPSDWWRQPRPTLAGTDPENWSNADIEDATLTDARFGRLLDAGAWQRVRKFVYAIAQEKQ